MNFGNQNKHNRNRNRNDDGENGDDDDFAPNPFRSSNENNNDFLGPPNPPAPAPAARNMNYVNQQQPDPYSGMTGSVSPVQRPLQEPQESYTPDPSLWSGTMDERAVMVEHYGGKQGRGQTMMPDGSGTANTEFTRFHFFSLNSWVACFRLDAYQKYFNVDTIDVAERLKASLFKFHQPDQFRTAVVGDFPTETLKGPDLYGPVWIVMTLVFVLAATSNIYAFWANHRSQRAAAATTTLTDGETHLEEFQVNIRLLLQLACFSAPISGKMCTTMHMKQASLPNPVREKGTL